MRGQHHHFNTMKNWIKTIHIHWLGIEFGIRKSCMSPLANGTLYETFFIEFRAVCRHRAFVDYWVVNSLGFDKHYLQLGILTIAWGEDIVEV